MNNFSSKNEGWSAKALITFLSSREKKRSKGDADGESRIQLITKFQIRIKKTFQTGFWVENEIHESICIRKAYFVIVCEMRAKDLENQPIVWYETKGGLWISSHILLHSLWAYTFFTFSIAKHHRCMNPKRPIDWKNETKFLLCFGGFCSNGNKKRVIKSGVCERKT